VAPQPAPQRSRAPDASRAAVGTPPRPSPHLTRALLVASALAVLGGCREDWPLPTAPARPSLSQAAGSPVVTTLADPGDGTCADAGTGDGCTLREAIALATPGGTITFGVTGTINLTS
jgi:CSLREA domain-containing protein